ncbi:hypothetical protein QR680_017003 [Steinernema hermaphroditum]|uniref:small monomeric GTPase n=1 Tax=Steinernema hermaphroditum TaxID=289476 RepID=A0AA39HEZ9_9BILA|nr:hypothetical protein QR680_017003 [Steinernema hermaphroditum]
MALWLWGWLDYVLDYLGFAQKKARIVFLGLDNVGKTTLMRRIRDDTVHTHAPTYHPTSEEFSVGGVRITAFDLGGHEQVRRVWKEYLPCVDAVIFVVDASDRSRIPEARIELEALLIEEAMAQCPFLVIGNKIDREGALSEATLNTFLGLDRFCTGKTPAEVVGSRPVETFMCSVVHGVGYGAALRWLAAHLH